MEKIIDQTGKVYKFRTTDRELGEAIVGLVKDFYIIKKRNGEEVRKLIDRPRPEYLMVGENAPMKRCKVHIWKRKSNPKKCKNCGTMKI